METPYPYRLLAARDTVSALRVLQAIHQELDARLKTIASTTPTGVSAGIMHSTRPQFSTGTQTGLTTRATETFSDTNSRGGFIPRFGDLPDKVFASILRETTAVHEYKSMYESTSSSLARQTAIGKLAQSSYVYRLIKLSHVNHAWRTAIINEPHFWSTLFPSRNTKIINLIVGRAIAGDSRIHIILDYNRFSSHPKKIAQEELTWMSALLPHSHRWGTLDFQNVPDDYLIVHRWLIHRTPRLQHLLVRDLSPNHCTHVEPSTVLFGGVAPTLQKLVLVRLNIPVTAVDFRLLVEFRAEYTSYTLGELFRVLQAAPLLRVLKLSRAVTYPDEPSTQPPARVHLPLVKLHLINTTTPLLYIQSPLLTHLRLDSAPQAILELPTFLLQASKLVYLSIVHAQQDSTNHNAPLQQMADLAPVLLDRLEYLAVARASAHTRGFLGQLICPRLSYLQFQSCQDDRDTITYYAPITNVASAALIALLRGPATLLARFTDTQSSFALWPSETLDASAAMGLTIYLDHPTPSAEAVPNSVNSSFDSFLNTLPDALLVNVDRYEHQSHGRWALHSLNLVSQRCPNIRVIRTNSESGVGEELAKNSNLLPNVAILALGQTAATWAEQDVLPTWMADLLVEREAQNFDFSYSGDFV